MKKKKQKQYSTILLFFIHIFLCCFFFIYLNTTTENTTNRVSRGKLDIPANWATQDSTALHGYITEFFFLIFFQNVD